MITGIIQQNLYPVVPHFRCSMTHILQKGNFTVLFLTSTSPPVSTATATVRHHPPRLQSRREMYATEVLSSFSVCRETSQSMAGTTSCVKISSFLRPICYVTSISMKFGGASTFCRCSAESKSVGGDIFSVTSSNKCDVDYLGESTKGDLNVKLEHLEAFGKIPIFNFPCLAPSFAV